MAWLFLTAALETCGGKTERRRAAQPSSHVNHVPRGTPSATPRPEYYISPRNLSTIANISFPQLAIAFFRSPRRDAPTGFFSPPASSHNIPPSSRTFSIIPARSLYLHQIRRRTLDFTMGPTCGRQRGGVGPSINRGVPFPTATTCSTLIASFFMSIPFPFSPTTSRLHHKGLLGLLHFRLATLSLTKHVACSRKSYG